MDILRAFDDTRRYFAERSATAAGLEYLGKGVDSIVFRLGDSAIKYARRSHLLDDAFRSRLAARKVEAYLELRSDVGSFMPPQSISIEPHLFRPGCEVVQTTQPFIRFTPAVVHKGLFRSVKLAPGAFGALDQLSNFLDAAKAADARGKILPDIYGRNNLVVDDSGKLLLIDTEPVTEDHPEDQGHIRHYIDDLRAQLDKIAA